MTRKAIFIVGPTASGKTDLAVKIARYFNGEIISADSRQVYEELDLGTGKEGVSKKVKSQKSKVKSKERILFIKSRARFVKNIPQYLIDIVVPGGEMYNLALFLQDAGALMADIWSRGKLPIVVGGTGLYVTALLKGYKLPEKKQGRGEWHRKSSPRFDALVIGIETDRTKLYETIDRRLDKRIELGMIDEVKKLLSSGVSPDWLERLGLEYRYTKRYLLGEIPPLNLPLGRGSDPASILPPLTSEDGGRRMEKTNPTLILPLSRGGLPRPTSSRAGEEGLHGSEKQYRDQLRYAIHAYARRQLTWLRHQIDGVEWVTTSAQAANLAVKFLKDKP